MNSDRKKTILITGAAGGVGFEIARIASHHEWQVVMLDKDKRALERRFDQIVAEGASKPFLHVLDLTELGPGDCDRLAGALSNDLGGLDALVHCAVLFPGLQPLDLIEPSSWLQQIQVNVNAPWMLSNELMPLLKQSNNAHLIFFLDENSEGKPLWGAYATSKAALKSLAAQFRAELRNTNIEVLSIEPGAMRTSLRSSVFHSENPLEVTSPEVRAQQIFEILNSNGRSPEQIIRLT